MYFRIIKYFGDFYFISVFWYEIDSHKISSIYVFLLDLPYLNFFFKYVL